jgi:P27 family predicted phage terminase small subunit
MRGRKPKPTAQRELEGNPGHRPLNGDEPLPPPPDDAFDAPPLELDGNALAADEWRRLAPMLRTARQITIADRSALVALCLEWARYITATKKTQELGLVVKAPSGYPMTNPYLSIATKALAGCNRLWPELGLTPSSRSRVKTEGPGPGGDAFSEFDVPLPLAGGLPTKH